MSTRAISLFLKVFGISLFFFTLFFVRNHVEIHGDNLFFLYAAKMLLQGGNYTHNFFETNPPLIILLNLPVIYLTKKLSINSVNAFHLYITSLATLSLGLTNFLLKEITREKSYRYLMLFAIAVIFLFLPVVAFGQRENLLIILTMPYLFLMALRVNNQTIPTYFAMLIGLMAGLGFALKPYFFTTFILVESYFMWHCYADTKNPSQLIKNFFLPEVLVIFLVCMSYLGIVFWYFSDYIQVIIPLIKKYYDRGSLVDSIFNPIMAYCYFICAIRFIPIKKKYSKLTTVLTLALIGFILSTIIAGTPQYYHCLPPLSIASLLAVSLCIDFSRIITEKEFLIWATVTLIILFILPFNLMYFSDHELILFRAILLIATSFTFVLSYSLLKNIFPDQRMLTFIMLTLILTAIFSAQPFGQREQLIIMFILPYIFSIINQPEAKLTQYSIGALAGIALCLNPLTFLVVAMTESYLWVKQKKFNVFRLELVVVIGTFLLCYFAIPNLMLNVLSKYYFYATASIDKSNQFTTVNLYLCSLIGIISILNHRKTLYPRFNIVLGLTLISFILISFLTPGRNALLPAVFSAILLAASILGQILFKKSPSQPSHFIKISSILLIILSLLSYPLASTFVSTSAAIRDKNNDTKLLAYFNQFSGSTFSYLSYQDALLVIDAYSNLHFTGLFPMFWWWEKMHPELANHPEKAIAQQDNDFFITALANNIDKSKPDLIFMDVSLKQECSIHLSKSGDAQTRLAKAVASYQCHYVSNPDYDFVKIFSRNNRFRQVWENYQYLNMIDNTLVFKRKNTGPVAFLNSKP